MNTFICYDRCTTCKKTQKVVGYSEIERPKEVVHSTMNRFFAKGL